MAWLLSQVTPCYERVCYTMGEEKSLNVSLYDIRFTLHNPVIMSKNLAVTQDPTNRLRCIWDDAELVGEAAKKLMPEFMDKIMSDITIEVYKSTFGKDDKRKIGEYRPWETLQASMIDHEKFFGKPVEEEEDVRKELVSHMQRL